jgi:ketosteroid isomerase-like protein
MATEPDIEASVQIEFALRNLNADFCYFLDHGQTDRLVDLFTTDAVYTHADRSSEGRDAIAGLFDNRIAAGTRTARHMQSGLRLQIVDEQTATGESVCMTFAADQLPPVTPATPYLVADFIDEYKLCADGKWRISRRHIERIFVDPENSGPIGSGS